MDERDLSVSLRELAEAIRAGQEEQRASVEKLEKTVGRFVVVCERLLAANDAKDRQASRALANLSPELQSVHRQVEERMRKRAVRK